MHWRTPRENHPPCRLPVHLEGLVFYPHNCLKWLGFLFTPSFDPRAHFSHRLSLANAAFATIRHLSPPGIGLPPHLCLTLARSLLAPILLYGLTVWHPPPTIMDPMSVFWWRVCRWTTNCFSTTNSICLYKEACLALLPCLILQQHCLAGLWLLCSPQEVNPATACLPKLLLTFSSFRAPHLSQKKIIDKPYLFFNWSWDCPLDKNKNPRYQYNAITTLAFMATPLLSELSPSPQSPSTLRNTFPPLHRSSPPTRGSRPVPNNPCLLIGARTLCPTTTPSPQPPFRTPLWA